MTNYAVYTEKFAYLFTEFGEKMARKWFGNEIVDSLPKYVRGKHKGKPKGVYTWKKVTRGGWVKDGSYGFVETRVGMIVERQLCEQLSGRYGYGTGDLLFKIGPGETWLEQKLRRVQEYHLRLLGDLSGIWNDLRASLRLRQTVIGFKETDIEKFNIMKSMLIEERENTQFYIREIRILIAEIEKRHAIVQDIKTQIERDKNYVA